MIAVVSLLDEQHSQIVNEIIADLEKVFGIAGVKITADPHITWLICDVNKQIQLKDFLGKVASQTPSIKVKTTGLGIFPGEHPVVFVPVIRADGFNQVHAMLYQGIQAFSKNNVNFYNPDQWVPHISLALRDTTPELLPLIILHLNKQTYNWEIELNNISILKKENDHFKLANTYSLLDKVTVFE